MKSQQTLKVKSLKARSSPKRFFANYKYSPTSKQISPSKQSKYNDFIEGYPSPNSSLRQLSDVLTQKQLAKISLFESVRKAKGQFYFKTIYQKSKFTELTSPIKTEIQQFLVQRKYFVYLLSGQVHLYKLTEQGMKNYGKSQKQVKDLKQGVQSVMNKCYIRSYGAHEHFGYQQYPLYWKERLFIQSAPDTKVIMFPLDTFYKVFSNVISLAAIQITAEFFKKISVFKETQMEKLLRISTFCQRIRTYPNTTIVEKGQKIQNIILLYDGRISLSNKEGFYTEETNGILMGKQQIDEKKTNFQHQIRALIQCDLIVIPLAQFSKVSQIRHKLRDSILDDGQKNIKSRKKMRSNLSQHQNDKKYSVTGYQTLEEQIFKQNYSTDSFKGTKSNTFMIVDQNETKTNSPKTMVKHRPKTASVVLSMNRGVSRSIIYDDNGRQFFVNRSKTSSSEKHSISNAFKSCQSQTKISSAKQPKQNPQNLTMGEIYWAKFMNRKQQLQNKQITKIINARLPESILNTGKQYSVMKPFVQKKSSYIKNYKRKLRQSHRVNQIDKIGNDEESTNLLNLKVEPQNQMNKFCLKSFIIVDDQI